MHIITRVTKTLNFCLSSIPYILHYKVQHQGVGDPHSKKNQNSSFPLEWPKQARTDTERGRSVCVGGGWFVREFKSQAAVIHVLMASTTGLLNLAHSLIADSCVWSWPTSKTETCNCWLPESQQTKIFAHINQMDSICCPVQQFYSMYTKLKGFEFQSHLKPNVLYPENVKKEGSIFLFDLSPLFKCMRLHLFSCSRRSPSMDSFPIVEETIGTPIGTESKNTIGKWQCGRTFYPWR